MVFASGQFGKDAKKKQKKETKMEFASFVAATKQKTHPILLEYLKSLIAKETPGVTVEAYFENLKKTEGFAVR